MSSAKFHGLAVVVALVALGGIIVLAVVYSDGLDRRPWLPLGIGLVAFDAVGAVIMTVMQAMRTEDRSAWRERDGERP